MRGRYKLDPRTGKPVLLRRDWARERAPAGAVTDNVHAIYDGQIPPAQVLSYASK